MTDSRVKLWAYRSLTAAALTAATAGVVLPLLPTTPFLLLAAWSASRHSPHLEAQLLAHPRFGPHLVAWRTQRALAPRAKRGALLALAVSYGVIWFTVSPLYARIGAGGVLVAVALFLATRPTFAAGSAAVANASANASANAIASEPALTRVGPVAPSGSMNESDYDR